MTTLLQSRKATAVVFKDVQLSYTSLLDAVNQLAHSFTIAPQDKVVIFSENRPEWITALYAVWKNNGIAVPVDHLLPPADVAYIIDDCKPTFCFTSEEKAPILNAAIATTQHKPTVLVFSDYFAQLNTSEPEALTNENTDNTAVILYTSGTTGKPKGVMLSYTNILLNVKAVTQQVILIEPADALICLLPFHHVLPLVGNIILPLTIGCKIAISPSLQGSDIIDTLQKNKITIVIGVPQLFAALRNSIMTKIEAKAAANLIFKFAKKCNAHQLSKKIFKEVHQKFGGHIKYFVSGGAALDKEVAKDLYTLGFEVIEGYGMTETAPLISFTHPNKWLLGSVGFVMPFTEVKIQEGEICVRGKQVMKGYYNKPVETAETIIDGWLHTGDLGYIDNNGHLFITGRKKELIILSNGKNINPIEIEEHIRQLDKQITECGCFAMHDQLHLLISSNDLIAETTIQEIVRTYNSMAPSYKQIRKYYFTTEPLPKTRLGKTQRFQLSAIAKQLTSTRQTQKQPTSETYKIISTFLKKIISHKEIMPEDTFEFDLGLDSLQKISFGYFIQSTFGVTVSENTYKEYPTVIQFFENIEKLKNKTDLREINWNSIINAPTTITLPSTWGSIKLIKTLSSLFLKTTCRIETNGIENLPASPFIISANHQSYIDGLVIIGALPQAINKKSFFYAKVKSFKNKLKRYIAEHHNVIIVDMDNNLEFSIQQLTNVLKNNKNIVVFPEGTRTRTGDIGEFKPMYSILSKVLQIPIVPVAINGTYDAMPPGKFLPKAGSTIKVTFLPSVLPVDKEYEEINSEVKRAIESRLS